MPDIDGVKIKILKVHQDIPDADQPDIKPGFLMEVLRKDEGLLKKFGQTTFTVAYPGTIKAFHWHKKQADLWFVATGKAVVVLHDLRSDSPTFGQTQEILAGQGDYKVILIPIGVAHGYKVLGTEPVLLFYHTTESYNLENPDEERIAYDDPKIGFDWDKLDLSS
ncbi:spore coat protein [Candidatus Parcubacteria bacterium]|jgi:dTDP-4-dehydrorhamnose 3,5-epimerase|nr:MAG: spore coat protein [Candidatus Parcubacteria bacterium]